MILNGLTDMVIVTNSEGIIRFANPASFRVLGYEPNELIGQSLDSLVVNKDIKHKKFISDYINEGYHREIICSGRLGNARHKNGLTVPIYLYVGEMQEKLTHLFVGVIHKVNNE
jgi:PAS domain S-box-containing protein